MFLNICKNSSKHTAKVYAVFSFCLIDAGF